MAAWSNSSSTISRSSASRPIIRSRIWTALFVLFPISSQLLYISVPRRRRLKHSFTSEGALNIRVRNAPLFCEPVRQHCRHSSVEEIEYAVIHFPDPDSQFVNSIPEKIGLWPRNLFPASANPLLRDT